MLNIKKSPHPIALCCSILYFGGTENAPAVWGVIRYCSRVYLLAASKKITMKQSISLIFLMFSICLKAQLMEATDRPKHFDKQGLNTSYTYDNYKISILGNSDCNGGHLKITDLKSKALF